MIKVKKKKMQVIYQKVDMLFFVVFYHQGGIKMVRTPQCWLEHDNRVLTLLEHYLIKDVANIVLTYWKVPFQTRLATFGEPGRLGGNTSLHCCFMCL